MYSDRKKRKYKVWKGRDTHTHKRGEPVSEIMFYCSIFAFYKIK